MTGQALFVRRRIDGRFEMYRVPTGLFVGDAAFRSADRPAQEDRNHKGRKPSQLNHHSTLIG